MDSAFKNIKVTALLGGRPLSEFGKEILWRWEFEFTLDPLPNGDWQYLFNQIAKEKLEKDHLKDIEERDQLNDERKEVWEIELDSKTPGVVKVRCSQDEIKFLFIQLKQLISTANQHYTSLLKNEDDARARKSLMLEEVEELKRTLDFD